MKNLIYFAFLILFPSTANAYIGPGLGMGTIGVVLGILVVFVLTLFAIVWYPLKRLIKLLFHKKEDPTMNESEKTDPP